MGEICGLNFPYALGIAAVPGIWTDALCHILLLPRLELFTAASAKRTFEAALERVRRSFRLCVCGYVVMPEHVHLLLSEPIATPLKPKQGLNGPPALTKKKRQRMMDNRTMLVQLSILPKRKQLAFALLVIERMLPDLICFTQETGFDNSCFLKAKEQAWRALQNGSVEEELVKMCNHNAPDTEAFAHELTSYALNAALGIAEIAEFTIGGHSAHLATLLSLVRDSTDLYLSSLDSSISSCSEQNSMVDDSRIMKQELHREEEDIIFISDLPDELDDRAVSGLRDRASGYTALLPVVRQQTTARNSRGTTDAC